VRAEGGEEFEKYNYKQTLNLSNALSSYMNSRRASRTFESFNPPVDLRILAILSSMSRSIESLKLSPSSFVLRSVVGGGLIADGDGLYAFILS
jgi:hypothetical protein